jgi:uncharacterized membrane protein YhaH (DUF805 family)
MANSSAIANQPDSRRTPIDWLRLWFLLRDRVTRRDYDVAGFGLMALKYVVEFVVVVQLTGLLYTPLDFVNPLFSARQKLAAGAPDWFGFAWVLWALPFLWIAVGMSVRRALDAGISPWHGLWVLVPFVNIVAMLVLACLPSAPQPAAPRVSDVTPRAIDRQADAAATVKAAVGGIAVGALYASVLTQASVYLFHSYGAAIFFGTPFVTGVASSYLLNMRASRSYATSIGVSSAALLFGGLALLLLAFEGVICLFMAAPIVLALGIAGAPIGKFLADRRRHQHAGLVGAMLILPVLAAAEARLQHENEFVVTSQVDTAAPPEAVWRNVIRFSRITDPPEWIFRWGIACPVEARIFGEGVGARRECVFTTGKFVEPIAVWDEPRRLAFDVSEQPAPMFELTPYRHIHPPHLDLSFRTLRGEFELVPLSGGGTRLVGRTWYTLDIRPVGYWAMWSDWLLHRIHLRVLRHIKRLAEGESDVLAKSEAAIRQ